MRRGPRIAVTLAASIVTPVAVAWVCALLSHAPAGGSGAPSIRLASSLPEAWLHLKPSSYGDPRYASCGSDGVWRGFGATVEGGNVIGREGTPELPSCSVFAIGSIWHEQCGWPWRSFECVAAEGRDGNEHYLTGGVNPPGWLRRKVVLPLGGFGFAVPYRPAIPMAPLWKGLMLNWGMFAAFFAAVLIVPYEWPRFMRARRGQCLECGFDRRGTRAGGQCPECGAAVHAALSAPMYA